MTTILAIDTSTGPCSVAVWHDGRIAVYVENSKPVMQSASLMPMVEDTLAESGLCYKDLNLVAATVGPGSFTGIRVGLASAIGIAYATAIPGVGYTTLEVLAHAAGKQAGPVLSALNAGKGEYYYQPYEISPRWQALSEPAVGSPETVASTLGTPALTSGNVVLEKTGFTPVPVDFPRADILAGLAASDSDGLTELKPFYIRAPDAKLPTKHL